MCIVCTLLQGLAADFAEQMVSVGITSELTANSAALTPGMHFVAVRSVSI